MGDIDMILNLNNIYKRNVMFKCRNIYDTYIIDGNRRVFEINKTGYLIWGLLDGKRTVKQIIECLYNEYECELENLVKDISGFICILEKNEFIILVK